MGGAYLCAEAGISNTVIENQAAYLTGWLGKIMSSPFLESSAGYHKVKETGCYCCFFGD
jgi:hypothetical protein